MEIYAEDFFIFNFLMDFFVFKSFSFAVGLSGTEINKKRFYICLTIFSLSSFIPYLFFEAFDILKYCLFLILPICLCGRKKYFENLFILTCLFSVFGGILNFVSNVFSDLFSLENNIIYIFASIFILSILINIFKKIRNTVLKGGFKRRVLLENDGRKEYLNGFLDSGNLLTDNMGRPVSAVSEDILRRLKPKFEDYITIQTVDGTKIIKEYKVEKMSIIGKAGQTTMENVFLVENKTTEKEFEILLNSQFV